MATSPKNRIVQSVNPNSIFEAAIAVISSASTFNQGDLCFFDDTANIIKPVSADADGVTFLGISRSTVVAGKLKSPFTTDVDASIGISEPAGPQYGVVASMKLKSGDTFNPGDLIFGTAVDAQTVSSAGTNAIGIYVDATLTAGASSVGNCRIGLRFRTTGLVL